MYGTGVRELQSRNRTFLIDGKNSTISAKVPDETETKEIIYTNPSKLLKQGNVLPSLSIIRFSKVKNFIDGVYASIEERVAEKGHKLSRTDFLTGLESVVEGEAKNYISSAIKYQTGSVPEESVVQGFYDWNDRLRNIYRQIKILAKNNKESQNIYNVLKQNPHLKNIRKAIIDLYSKTANTPVENFALFPSAKLPDQEFFMQLSQERRSDITEGLGKALVSAIKSGRVKFEPDKHSGMYIRQMFEMVPLILRNNKEFKKFLINKNYEKALDDEFISQWAGTRHTHVGHTYFRSRLLGACISHNFTQEPIIIRPEIKVEPFSTSYDRMRSSIEFLEKTIKNALPEVLDRKRVMNDSSRSAKLIGEEFGEMKLLLKGLSLISKDSLHMTYKDKSAKDTVEYASNWIKNAGGDLDINRNNAIFVPIVRTSSGSHQIGYINAGFKLIDVTASYEPKPIVRLGNTEIPSFGIKWETQKFKLPYLVHREVRIPVNTAVNDKILRSLLPENFSKKDLDVIVKKLENDF